MQTTTTTTTSSSTGSGSATRCRTANSSSTRRCTSDNSSSSRRCSTLSAINRVSLLDEKFSTDPVLCHLLRRLLTLAIPCMLESKLMLKSAPHTLFWPSPVIRVHETLHLPHRFFRSALSEHLKKNLRPVAMSNTRKESKQRTSLIEDVS